MDSEKFSPLDASIIPCGESESQSPNEGQNKKPLPIGNGLLVLLCKLDSAGYFTRTQATGAGVDVARSTIYNCLHTSNIRFPASVRSSMRMRNLNTESNAFSADIAFSH